jgi:hypothetical protein
MTRRQGGGGEVIRWREMRCRATSPGCGRECYNKADDEVGK